MSNTLILLVVLDFLLVLILYVLVAYVLAHYDICFTFGIEGAAKAVVKNGVYDRMLMWWRGHYLNTRGYRYYKKEVRTGEVLPTKNPDMKPSQYKWWQLHWKFLELFGIYWYGPWPFKEIYVHEFEWTEIETDERNNPRPLHRKELTDFIYVKNFPYWVTLPAAEDADNEPLNLDYLLTIHVNNPYWALFRTEDWLKRVTANGNNRAKIYVGSHKFNEIKKESVADNTTMSEFAHEICTLNTNLVTEPGVRGTRISCGVTINGSALVGVTTAGIVAPQVETALAAKRVAELQGEATVATAKAGADAVREEAKGQADAIDTVYGKVKEYENLGVELQRLDALKQASKSPGSTVIWAANPFGGIADWFRKPPSPAANTNTPQP